MSDESKETCWSEEVDGIGGASLSVEAFRADMRAVTQIREK